MSKKKPIYKRKKNLGSYPNGMVILSITLALFVIGLFGVMLLYANKLSGVVKENIGMHIYLHKHISDNERIKIKKILSVKKYIVKKNDIPQIEYVSKEQAAEKFMKEAGDDFVSFLGQNPLRDALLINIKPMYFVSAKMSRIKSDLENIHGIYEVEYRENVVEAINKNMQKIGIVLLGITSVLLITIVVLINNTIKLAMFSQRFLIRSMQLVGATASFIRRPFLSRAAYQGFISGMIASFLLLCLLQYANTQLEELVVLQNTRELAIIMAFLVITGIVIGLFSSYRAVNKYLKMSLDELY
ncbi:MAG: ABC transporter permease [Cytophagales bacterium]|nr:ABC transporter permease [Cytophagales bacterium]